MHDIDDIMEKLGCAEPHLVTEKRYYHFQIPLCDLDFGLFALGYDDDIRHLARYVSQHKLINVYIEHGETKLHT